MKMIKMNYNHKQEKLKKETQQRLQKYKQEIEMKEAVKGNKLKQKKKNVFRMKSKAAGKKN